MKIAPFSMRGKTLMRPASSLVPAAFRPRSAAFIAAPRPQSSVSVATAQPGFAPAPACPTCPVCPTCPPATPCPACDSCCESFLPISDPSIPPTAWNGNTMPIGIPKPNLVPTTGGYAASPVIAASDSAPAIPWAIIAALALGYAMLSGRRSA